LNVARPDFVPGGAVLGTRFSVWLLRPYLDLGPLVVGPLYARGVEEYWNAFNDPQNPPFCLQRTLSPAFRQQLIEESGRTEFSVEDPRDLPTSLRTARWAAVCDALATWHDLSVYQKCRMVLMLHSLCLYEAVLKLVPGFDGSVSSDAMAVELGYWRASAEYALRVPNRISSYHTANLSVFEAIALMHPVQYPRRSMQP
jgi:hypothetical protein